MKFGKIQFLQILILLIILNSLEAKDSAIAMASKFGCDASKKIEIKDLLNNCQCSDGSTCVWTADRKPVYGCPCPVFPENTNYQCPKMAMELGCSDKKIECTSKMGQCECEEGGLCFWAGTKPIAGCPCRGGRVPDPKEFENNNDKKKKAKPKKSKKGKGADELEDL